MPLRTTAELTDRFDVLRESPTEVGILTLVVRRPANGRRDLLEEGVLDETEGLVGDNWLTRATSRAIAAGRHLDAQLTVMSARMVGLLSDDPREQALAGDQLYVDLDLSHENLPAGARLSVGDKAVIEVTAKPHAGCKKFLNQFGEEAVAFVNSDVGRAMRLRGLNARIVTGGVIRPGDVVRKL